LKKNSEKSCKILRKWFSGSVETNQNQTEKLSQKPQPNHNQIQTEPKPKELEPVATLINSCFAKKFL
jgi:hypothetical protein